MPTNALRPIAGARPHQYAASAGSWRELAGAGYPSLKEQVAGAVSSAGRNGLRKGHRHGETGIRPMPASLPSKLGTAHLMRPRSSSPSRPSRQQRSPLSASNTSSTLAPGAPGSSGLRRGSWQPNRKTTQELEDECRDSDEDIPDDAIVWNVPISPRPPQERSRPWSSASNKTSPASSPDRANARQPPAPCALPPPLKIPPGAPWPNRRTATSPLALRPSPTEPIPPATADPDLAPTRPLGSRAASWNVALSALSEETQDLTEALEELADQRHAEAAARRSRDASQRRPSGTAKVDLPTMRKGNVMIDPLPVSKEKEAVLSRTRPSWLPPKDQEEERRHLREYQKMVAHSIESDRRKAARDERLRRLRDETRLSLGRIWDQHILPNWEHALRQPRTRELWWRGIAPRSRGAVWARAVGNELGLSADSFQAALTRARAVEAQLLAEEESLVGGRARRERDWFRAIRRDVRATYPELGIFQPGGALHEPLLDVLSAYAMYRSDVGYSRGSHLIAALLLLNLPGPQAFITLSNLLNQALPLYFQLAHADFMTQTYALTLRALQYKFPVVHAQLTSPALRLAPDDYLGPLFRSLFTRALPLEHVSRVWDVYVFERDPFLVRTAVAVLGRVLGARPYLYRARADVLRRLAAYDAGDAVDAVVVVDRVPHDDLGPEDEFMSAVRAAVSCSSHKYEQEREHKHNDDESD
ncbi:MAG: hypothetical protein M1826_006254 [Phylliscum demangeonii]|nr:MAG: hypothetical protein M1826_006254 [Phylliscum demangeonii]